MSLCCARAAPVWLRERQPHAAACSIMHSMMPRALRPCAAGSSRPGLSGARADGTACRESEVRAVLAGWHATNSNKRGGSRQTGAGWSTLGAGPCARAGHAREPRCAALAGARQGGRASSGNAHRRSPTRCAPNVMQRTCACGQAAAAKVAASRASAPPSANPAATTRAGASPPDTSRAACAPRPPLLARASRGALRRRGSLRGARACQHCRHCRQATEEGAPEVAGVARAADAYAGRP